MSRTPPALLTLFRDFFAPLAGGPAQPFLAGIAEAMPERDLVPRPLPCLRHLERTASLAAQATAPLASFLVRDGGALHWGQTYTTDDFGADFLNNYGWLELCGARGHFASDRVAAGFLLLGPDLLYPDHHHLAEEIYIPLTGGTEWRMGDAPFAEREAGEIIHHASNVPHAMRTGVEPLLAIYLWRGGPLTQKSVIAGAA